MSAKANFSALVGEALLPLGYRAVASGVFRKSGRDFDYQVLLSFTGKVAIECRVFFGFCIGEIDQRLNSLPSIKQQVAAGSKNMATIFASLDVVAQVAGAEADYSIELEKEWPHSIERIVHATIAIEKKFSNVDDVALFSLKEPSLALGHHAFRVPLLLKFVGRDEEYTAYVDRVHATGFIPNYDDFLREVADFKA